MTGKKRNKTNNKPEQSAKPASDTTLTKKMWIAKNPAIVFLFIFSFLLYANTISFDYALDDKLYITHNEFTKKGFAGIKDIMTTDLFVGFYGKQKNLVAGGRYRPLSLVTFAIEYQFFGESPRLSHFINVLFYAFTIALLFIVLLRLFPPEAEKKWYLQIAFLITLIFAAHPLHTEVVANIKSRDELMSFIGALAALYFTFRYIDANKAKYLAGASALFFLSLLSKETSLTFVAVIPFAVYFFSEEKIKKILGITLPFMGVFIVYFLIRTALLGTPKFEPIKELMNDPFIYATTSQKFATIILTMGLYIKLLFIPHPLTHDYYPWHPLGYDFSSGKYPYANWADMAVIITVLIYLLLIGIAAFGLKKKNIMAFAVILFLATFSISSNLIFPIGTLMNERFMYIPSLGFALALVYLINKITINKMLINTFIVSVVVLFSIKTFSRNFAWKNDYALAMADVETSKYSAKINMSAGGALIEKCKELTDTLERKKTALKAVEYLEWSLKLYPGYGQPIDLLGNAHFEAGNYNESIKYFETFITSNPTDKRVVNNVEIVGNFCMQKNLIQQAEYAYKVRIKFDPPSVHAYAQLGEIFGKHKNNLDSSLYFLEKAYSIQPENTDVLQKMGVVYAMKNNPQQALLYFTKALDIDPQNAHIMLNMSIAYRQMGQNDKAEEFFARAKALNSSI